MLKQLIGVSLLTIVVIVAIGFGIYLSGSPIENRAIRYDEIRIKDFSTLKTGIDNYYADHFKLPSSLIELSSNRAKTDKPYIKKEPKDPQTKQSYQYQAMGAGKYEICATFETSSDDIKKRKTGLKNDELDSYNSYDYDVDTSHPKGFYCIPYTVAAYLQDRYNDNLQTPPGSRVNPYSSFEEPKGSTISAF